MSGSGGDLKEKKPDPMKNEIFRIECYVDGHTYIICTDDSPGSLDIETNRLVDVLYSWTNGCGPLDLEDVCGLLEAFCELRSEHEVWNILNSPRFSAGLEARDGQ
tara:strand:+ start:320 stop:634 length:315 start_codon:yes stop_codon:yes gene_type:complete